MKVIENITIAGLFGRFARGSLWSGIGAFLSMFIGLCTWIIVPVLLGPAKYGVLGIIQSTIGIFGVFAGMGMGLTSTKYIAEFKNSNSERAGKILALTGVVAWISGLAMMLTVIFFAPLLVNRYLSDIGEGVFLIRMGSFLLLIGSINGAQAGALMGFEAFKKLAFLNIVSAFSMLFCLTIGVWRWEVSGAVAGLVISGTVSYTHLTLPTIYSV